MYGELTDKETISRLEYALENQIQDQFEMLLYKSNSKSKYSSSSLGSLNFIDIMWMDSCAICCHRYRFI